MDTIILFLKTSWWFVAVFFFLAGLVLPLMVLNTRKIHLLTSCCLFVPFLAWALPILIFEGNRSTFEILLFFSPLIYLLAQSALGLLFLCVVALVKLFGIKKNNTVSCQQQPPKPVKIHWGLWLAYLSIMGITISMMFFAVFKEMS